MTTPGPAQSKPNGPVQQVKGFSMRNTDSDEADDLLERVLVADAASPLRSAVETFTKSRAPTAVFATRIEGVELAKALAPAPAPVSTRQKKALVNVTSAQLPPPPP